MKVLYQRARYLRHSLRTARRNLKRRRVKKLLRRSKSAARVQQDIRNRSFRLPEVTMHVPTVFSITDNTKDTLAFFSGLENAVVKRRRVFLDMADCQRLDIDALLYVLSRFHSYDLNDIPTKIRGNVPKETACQMLLMSSGFLQHVRSKLPASPPDPHILRIESGALIDNAVAQSVVDFTLKHLKRSVTASSRAIYRILIEMMGNTREHAFIRQTKTSKWHLLAVHNKHTSEIQFAFLDGGQGIPTTIRRNFAEKVNQLIAPLIQAVSSSLIDAQLLKSALNGEFRSKTGHRYRGKGMPEINKLANEHQFDKLKLVSGRGFVDCITGHAVSLDSPFYGTLYTWVFR